MVSILIVDHEILRLDIREAHAAVFTTAQNPDILRVLAVGASSLELSSVSSCSPKQLDAFFTWKMVRRTWYLAS